MQIIFQLLLIILVSSQAFASSNQVIERRSIRFDPSNDLTDRLDAQEKEMQQLLGRIEVLEHNMAKLESHLNLDQQATKEQQNSNVLPDSVQEADVFDVSSIKEIDNKVSSNVPDAKQTAIAQDKQFYDLALATLKENKLEQAEAQFMSFIQNYPDSPLLSNAYFWYGETFFKRNMFNKAAINYLKCYKHAPKGAKASDSLLKLSLSLGELKKQQEACNIIAKLEAEFPSRAAISIKKAKDAKIKFGCKSGQ